MASARRSTETVVKTITAVKPIIKDIILTLSHEEAQFLADLTAAVSGKSENTARKYADSILQSLRNIGINYGDKPHEHIIENSVRCLDGSLELIKRWINERNNNV